MCIGKDITGESRDMIKEHSVCHGFERDFDKIPMIISSFWCIWCNAVPRDDQDEVAWKYEHLQRCRPDFYVRVYDKDF